MEMFLNNFTIIETILRDRASFFAAIRDNIDLWTKIEAMLVSCITVFRHLREGDCARRAAPPFATQLRGTG